MLFTVWANHTHGMKVQLLFAPRPIIAKFVVREDRDTVFSVKNGLKSSYRYSGAYTTQDFAHAIQQERKTLIQAMFAAKKKGRDAKVINRKLFIDDNAYDISNIPIDFKVACIWFTR